MTVLERLEAGDWHEVVAAFHAGLAEHREEINALNVYPVPDGDTGTNMALTLRSVRESLQVGMTMAEVCEAVSHGSLMGARGNSGVIMSQILRGLAGHFRAAETIGPGEVAAGLTIAAKAAYGAVGNPVEGTILTVVRECAEKAEAVLVSNPSVSLLDLLVAIHDEGYASLERTPDLLQVLKDAGVVDAGGRGFLLLIDAALHVVDGRSLPMPEVVNADLTGLAAANEGRPDEHNSIADLRYEVMFLLDAVDDRIDEFKASWAEIGDSIVVVGGDGLWNCHIHSDDIGASIEAGIAVGRPHQIRVTDLLEELDHREDLMEAGTEAAEIAFTSTAEAETAVICVGSGDGVRDIFASLGVQAVVLGGQTMNPSTQLLLEAVEKVNADQVVILPNNKNIIAVAEQVDSQTTKTVRVVPTRSVAEGFAALMAYDPGSLADANVASMIGAAEVITAGEITQAVRDSDTEVGPILVGDWLGLKEGKIVAIDADLATLAGRLLANMVGEDAELVTIICGEAATSATTNAIGSWLQEHRPDAELEVHQGGQPLYPYYIGVE